MVKLDVVHAANTSLVKNHPLVAVFFGGNSGIGSYTIRALAKTAANGGKPIRAYIVARNATSAEAIIAECKSSNPQGDFKFVKADDISLLQDVDRVCAEIVALEEQHGDDARIDYLMLSQGGSIFLPRKETKEGIDVTMSLMYYSRMRAITNLLPLLLKSALPATVVSVYAAGMEGKIYPEDLSLRNLDHYSYSQARSHMCYMHILFMETLVQQHPDKLRMIHIFPGLVLGPGFHNPELPRWFRIIWHWIFVPVFGRFVTVPTEESGARMLSLASPRYPPRPAGGRTSQGDVVVGSDGKPGGGVYSLTWNGDSNLNVKAYGTINKDEMKSKIQAHTLAAFEAVKTNGIFTD